MPVRSIIGTAVQRDDLQGFLYSTERLELWDMLDSKGPFTVFAPNDSAFKAIPDRIFDELMDTNVLDLAFMMDNHFVHGSLIIDDVKGSEKLSTVNGNSLAVSSKDGGIYIEDAKIVEADVRCTNGIIHVVDKLLIPSELKHVLALREIQEKGR